MSICYADVEAIYLWPSQNHEISADWIHLTLLTSRISINIISQTLPPFLYPSEQEKRKRVFCVTCYFAYGSGGQRP